MRRRFDVATIPGIVAAMVVLTTAFLIARMFWSGRGWSPPAIDFQPEVVLAPAAPPAYDLAQLAVIWQRDLHQAVIDVAQVVTQAPSESPPPVTLVGTAVEPKQQYGVFRCSDNLTVVRAVGAAVEGYEVISIARGRAVLRSGSRQVELIVPNYERIRQE